MKTVSTLIACGVLAFSLFACGSDKTVVEKPVIVTTPGTTTTTVE